MAEELKSEEEAGTSLKPEDFEALRTKLAEAETKNEELGLRVETMQESLDNALEELSLRTSQPEAEPIREDEPKLEPKTKALGEKLEEGDVEVEIKKSIEEEETFRTEQQRRLEELELRETVRDLQEEIKIAKVKYPELDEKEVLLAIEDGSEVSVEELGRLSHERVSQQKVKLTTTIEEDLKARLKKEAEGGQSVPQSSGSPSAPKPEAPSGPVSSDDEWGTALKQAKVESGGVK